LGVSVAAIREAAAQDPHRLHKRLPAPR